MPPWQHRHLQPRAPFEKVGEIEVALALLGAEIARAEQAAESSVGGAVGGPDGDIRRPVAEGETATDGIACAGLLRCKMSAHNASQRVAVRDGKPCEAENRGGGCQFLRVRGAAQEREIRGGEQLGISGLAGSSRRKPMLSLKGDFSRRLVGGRPFRHVPVMFQQALPSQFRPFIPSSGSVVRRGNTLQSWDSIEETMPEQCIKEVERTIASATASGETLFVAVTARNIAARCGGPAEQIAEALTQAGIKAGLTMQFGGPA